MRHSELDHLGIVGLDLQDDTFAASPMLGHAMEASSATDVEEKFFFNPDLMEKFLPFLDSHTLLNLCRSKISCALDILQNRHHPSVWNKMIERSIPEIPDDHYNINLRFEEARTQILPLISLVKIM